MNAIDAFVAIQTVSLHSQARSTHCCVGNYVNEYTSIVSRINTVVCMNATAMLVTYTERSDADSSDADSSDAVGTCTLCIMCVYGIRSIACDYCLVINWW
jgi:hypothetical protein